MTNWTELLDEHGNTLLLFARQWSVCMADAEEAVQEGFVRFWKATGGDAEVGRLYAYVKRAAIDRTRSRGRRDRRERTAGQDLYDETPMLSCPLEEEEERELLERALQQLPVEQREVIVMKIWGELRFREIADSLGISINTAASRYRYGLRSLQKILDVDSVSSGPSLSLVDDHREAHS